MTQTQVNQTFRPSKTRRLVSAWVIREFAAPAMKRVEAFRDTFDQIIFMCGSMKGDGTLPNDWPIAERKELARRLRDMNVSPLIDYGGTWAECGQSLMKNPKLADEWVKRLVDEAEQVGADGVDIDVEHWPAEGRFAFTDFIHKLSEALHARGLMLSICLYALSPEARRETTIGFWDAALLAQYADHLRPMTYDLYCPPSQFIGPTSTAPWGRDCMSYMVTHVPRHKIIMGLPTYSVDWNINDPKQSRQVNDYEWIAAREKESPIGRGWCYYWDVNLIRFNDANNHAHLLYVSDARSTKSHLVTVDSMDLGGVCFWLLSGGDDPAIWQCVDEHLKRW